LPQHPVIGEDRIEDDAMAQSKMTDQFAVSGLRCAAIKNKRED